MSELLTLWRWIVCLSAESAEMIVSPYPCEVAWMGKSKVRTWSVGLSAQSSIDFPTSPFCFTYIWSQIDIYVFELTRFRRTRSEELSRKIWESFREETHNLLDIYLICRGISYSVKANEFVDNGRLHRR